MYIFVMICILWHCRKLSKPEYVLLWLTFLSITWFGLELGILYGIIMITIFFAYEYASSTVSSLHSILVSSGTRYSYSHMAFLDLTIPRKVVGLSLMGFVFFGNSISISTRVEQVGFEIWLQVWFFFLNVEYLGVLHNYIQSSDCWRLHQESRAWSSWTGDGGRRDGNKYSLYNRRVWGRALFSRAPLSQSTTFNRIKLWITTKPISPEFKNHWLTSETKHSIKDKWTKPIFLRCWTA